MSFQPSSTATMPRHPLSNIMSQISFKENVFHDEGTDMSFELSPDKAASTTLGIVNITDLDSKKVSRRRATISIPSLSQQARRRASSIVEYGDSFLEPRQLVTIMSPHKPQIYSIFNSTFRDAREDSAICLADAAEPMTPLPIHEDTGFPFGEVIPAVLVPEQDLMERVVNGTVEFPEILVDELPHLEEDKDELHKAAKNMGKDEVMFYQSSMDQVASVFLPKELKTAANTLQGESIVPISLRSNDDITVCVLGVGYVGEHLLAAFGNVFNAIGYDISQARINDIEPDFKHLPNVELTTDVSQLSRGTHFLISVPTNLHKDNSVNATHLLTAISTVAQYARPGSVVVIESSVSVGMTRAFLSPYKDTLHCGMSPERVDPGRTSPTLIEIPKVISGLDQISLIKIHEIYSQVFNKVVPVSRPEVAEMTKLYENCYRMINIAYVNEIADACAAQDIDANEVIDAASTKPFGFQAFRPGLGVGGHCIPINPYYLLVNNALPVLEHATSQMANRPAKIAEELYDEHSILSGKGGLRVLVVGVAFKPGQSVISCSPGLAFATAMGDLGCSSLMYYDPLVPHKDASWIMKMHTKDFTSKFIDASFDLVCVCIKQHGVDFRILDSLQSAHVKYL